MIVLTNIFDRRDIGYTIISRFEESLRYYISNKLPIYYSVITDGIPQGVIAKVNEKTFVKATDIYDFLNETDFPDLKEIICYKGMFKEYFPDDSITLEEFIEIMDELYLLRCKIAHVKGYFTSIDLDKLIEYTLRICSCIEPDGKEFIHFIGQVRQDPSNIIVKTPISFFQDECDKNIKIPNNVPTPDYEFEGGFVGREDDIRKIIQELEGNSHRVITISGAGGVGKTALALKVVHKLLNRTPPIFDGIIWLSAKESRLSYLGIEDIEPTLKNYEQLLDSISEVMGLGISDESIEKKEEDINTIFDLYNCILIVIDNLETITDERIINFIIDSHPKSKFLITSRKGLGQVERRYELRQLKEKEAIHLFRQIAKDKNITSLATLDSEVIKNYVKKVSYYPLAIKWVIGNVAIGKDIEQIIDSINDSTSDISYFCFYHIYNSLSDSAKKILCALCYFDEPPSAGILKYVVDISQVEFEDGISELILVSLVIPDAYKNEQNEIIRRFSLLSLTRGFVRNEIDKDVVFKRDIEDRLRTVQNTIEEAERAKHQYRFSLSNLGAVTEEEKVAAMIAQTAFQKYQAGRYFDAVDDYKRAIGIAPRFASLYRNWAVMESLEGHYVEADQLMGKASRLNSKDPQIWLTWGNMKRKNDKIKDAYEYYQKAYELSPNDYVIINSLGQAKSRLGEYEEANKLFLQALEQECTGSSRKHEIINRTSIADNLVRWAENLIADRNYDSAEEKLNEALLHAQSAVELDKSDNKSADLLRNVYIQLGFFYKKRKYLEKAACSFEKAIVSKPIRYSEIKDTIVASYNSAKLYFECGMIEKAREILSPKLLKFIRDHNYREDFNLLLNELHGNSNTVKGEIVKVDLIRRFVIIESKSSPGNTFLGHFSSFIPKIDEYTENLQNRSVSFVPIRDKKDRKVAKYIRLI